MKVLLCPQCGKSIISSGLRTHQFNAHGLGTLEPISHLTSNRTKAKTAKGSSARIANVLDQQRASASAKREVSIRETVADNIKRMSQADQIFESRINPSDDQRRVLERIFLAPEFCMFLVLSEKPMILTRGDAQLFLLQYKQKIDDYLPNFNRDSLRDMLADFVLTWSTKPSIELAIEFDCALLPGKTERAIRIAGIGHVKLGRDFTASEVPEPSRWLSTSVWKTGENYSIKIVLRSARVAPKASKSVFLGGLTSLPPSKIRKSKHAKFRADSRGNGVSTTCPLCGAVIESGRMLMHKHEMHGESMYSASTRGSSRGKGLWVACFQGGAPGLGKGKS